MAADGFRKVYAHLHDLGLFFEIRMKVAIALLHRQMLARLRRPHEGGGWQDIGYIDDSAVYDE